MWVTQCHKPPKFGIGLYIPPIIHIYLSWWLGGGVWNCVIHINFYSVYPCLSIISWMFARPTVRETVSKTDKTFLHCFENCLKLLENCFLFKQFYENCLNIVFYQKIFENNFMKIVQTLFLSKRSLKQFYEHCLNIVFSKDLWKQSLWTMCEHCFLNTHYFRTSVWALVSCPSSQYSTFVWCVFL